MQALDVKRIKHNNNCLDFLFITGPEKGFTPLELTTPKERLHTKGVRIHMSISGALLHVGLSA